MADRKEYVNIDSGAIPDKDTHLARMKDRFVVLKDMPTDAEIGDMRVDDMIFVESEDDVGTGGPGQNALSTDNTWTGSNNFNSALQKNGVDVATQDWALPRGLTEISSGSVMTYIESFSNGIISFVSTASATNQPVDGGSFFYSGFRRGNAINVTAHQINAIGTNLVEYYNARNNTGWIGWTRKTNDATPSITQSVPITSMPSVYVLRRMANIISLQATIWIPTANIAANTVIGTIPVGWRAPYICYIPVTVAGLSTGSIQVNTNGTMQTQFAMTSGTSYYVMPLTWFTT